MPKQFARRLFRILIYKFLIDLIRRFSEGISRDASSMGSELFSAGFL